MGAIRRSLARPPRPAPALRAAAGCADTLVRAGVRRDAVLRDAGGLLRRGVLVAQHDVVGHAALLLGARHLAPPVLPDLLALGHQAPSHGAALRMHLQQRPHPPAQQGTGLMGEKK